MIVKVTQRLPAAHADPRARLLDAALRLLAADGPEALQARRLAAEVGSSPMAVYTYLGGMGQLITEVVREGYNWFGQRLAEVPRSDDPVADLLALGMAYRGYALENPQLYRLMFGANAPGGRRAGNDPSVAAAAESLPEAQAAFAQLVALVAGVMEASAESGQESPGLAAFQIWSALHGCCSPCWQSWWQASAPTPGTRPAASGRSPRPAGAWRDPELRSSVTSR